jgi:hypothetical protein
LCPNWENISASYDAECKNIKYFEKDKIIKYFCIKYIVIKGIIVKNVKKFGLQIKFSYFCSRITKQVMGNREATSA